MGYRSEIALCLSDKAVRELKKRLAALGGTEEEADIRSLFTGSDVHHTDQETGDSLWVWSWVKWYDEFPEVRFVRSLLADMDEEDFLFVRVGEEYADLEHQGLMWDNAFDVNILREIGYTMPLPKATRAAGADDAPTAADRMPHFAEFRMCDASTLHIRPHDDDILEKMAGCREFDPLIAYPCERGYFLYLDQDIDDKDSDYAGRLARAGYSADFVALLRCATRAGFVWLKLDEDAPPYPELPVFAR